MPVRNHDAAEICSIPWPRMCYTAASKVEKTGKFQNGSCSSLRIFKQGCHCMSLPSSTFLCWMQGGAPFDPKMNRGWKWDNGRRALWTSNTLRISRFWRLSQHAWATWTWTRGATKDPGPRYLACDAIGHVFALSLCVSCLVYTLVFLWCFAKCASRRSIIWSDYLATRTDWRPVRSLPVYLKLPEWTAQWTGFVN